MLGREGDAELDNNVFASCAREQRSRLGSAHAERWPSYRLHTSQAYFFERFGLLAQAEREWRLALESKPNGKALDACSRSCIWRGLGGAMRARACKRYGVPPAASTDSGELVWKAGSVMAARAERERADEIAREGPKTWAEIFAQQNAHERRARGLKD